MNCRTILSLAGNAMKRLLLISGLLISLFASAQIDKVVPAKPSPAEGLVHDYAGLLTPDQEHSLENKLQRYDDSTSTQIAVVTLLTLTDEKGNTYEDEEAALKILREWGIGQKDKDNGIVILIVKSKDDKEKKIRIETGYGMEGAVPDATAGSIIRHSITPRFREGQYYRGLDEATNDIIKAAAGEYKAPKGYNKKKSKGTGIGGLILFIIIMLFAIGRRGGRGGGGMVSRRGLGDVATGWLIGSMLGGGRGGGWSGGGGGGWSGGGGGFGGFGGGSGGGGGASGSW
jgi:uncharacterized protein